MGFPKHILMPFPGPPIPLKLPEFEREEEEEVIQDPEVEFVKRMKQEGHDEELIQMGLKVAKNHLRTPAEAYKIGTEYIRSMSK